MEYPSQLWGFLSMEEVKMESIKKIKANYKKLVSIDKRML